MRAYLNLHVGRLTTRLPLLSVSAQRLFQHGDAHPSLPMKSQKISATYGIRMVILTSDGNLRTTQWWSQTEHVMLKLSSTFLQPCTSGHEWTSGWSSAANTENANATTYICPVWAAVILQLSTVSINSSRGRHSYTWEGCFIAKWTMMLQSVPSARNSATYGMNNTS